MSIVILIWHREIRWLREGRRPRTGAKERVGTKPWERAALL